MGLNVLDDLTIDCLSTYEFSAFKNACLFLTIGLFYIPICIHIYLIHVCQHLWNIKKFKSINVDMYLIKICKYLVDTMNALKEAFTNDVFLINPMMHA